MTGTERTLPETVPELVEDEDAYCEHGVHYTVECEDCQDEVDEEQYREERGL
jgi:hypothetical protein